MRKCGTIQKRVHHRAGVISPLLSNEMNRKLRGYYESYRITFNSRILEKYFVQVERILYLNRRGGKLTWEGYSNIFKKWLPLQVQKYIPAYQIAKPKLEEPCGESCSDGSVGGMSGVHSLPGQRLLKL